MKFKKGDLVRWISSPNAGAFGIVLHDKDTEKEEVYDTWDRFVRVYWQDLNKKEWSHVGGIEKVSK